MTKKNVFVLIAAVAIAAVTIPFLTYRVRVTQSREVPFKWSVSYEYEKRGNVLEWVYDSMFGEIIVKGNEH